MSDATAWRARSASDKTDNWPFWYVTDDRPRDYNKTVEALTSIGVPPELAGKGLPFLPREYAVALAEKMNGIGGQ